jgi:hypothetical protein|tara:strand:+ start:895 stop:1350 length:456 start_codon:yes stop_codon:yes gene_type:complete
MATTTAAITLTSADLLTDALSLSATNTLYKAGTTTGLDQTTGITKAYLTATTNIDIFPTLIEGSMAFAGKSSWVYICNESEDETEYAIITISGNVIGKLYAGDFLWMPWSQSEDGHGNNRHGDIELAPSVATGMWFSWCCINEGTEYPTAV